jgi:outer membrane protein
MTNLPSITVTNKLILTAAITAALFSSMPVQALEKGDIIVRARVININPNVNNGNQLTLHDSGQPIEDALGVKVGVDVDDATTLDIDFTYMVTNHVGLELLLDLTSKHDVNATDAFKGDQIGDVRVLPPSLIAQYHFLPNSNIRPYAGLGINYTFYFDESTHQDWDDRLGGKTKLSVNDTWGYVTQVGMDIDITDNWFFNIDAKYIGMNTKGVVKVDGVKSFDANFDVDPLVLGVGIGTTF